MEKTNLKQNILVNLDAILDTRLSVISSFDKVDINKILNSNYFTRQTDSFKGISDSEFKDRYKNRDKQTLKNAIACKSLNLLKEIVRTSAQQAINLPYHSGVNIHLNIYPYVLEDDEAAVIVSALSVVTNKMADIKIVSLTELEITPQILKANYAVVFFYEYANWLEIHTENFKISPCPEVSMQVPALYFGKVPTPRELEECRAENLHPFTALEKVASPLIGLVLLPIEMFCAALK